MDWQTIMELVRLMEEHDLAEIEIEEEGFKVRLKKAEPRVLEEKPTVPTGPPTTAGPPAEEFEEIRSPMVGTFYRAPSPGAPPFVEVGQEVTENTVVCIIEAMKVMNEIKAGVRGVITEVLVENGQPVDFNRPLFRVRKKLSKP
ncbi:acetyl-CoA carboxylase biotin carboxyl carrier protein [Candidatus Methylacidithermus pantelleriae]|uniref:Biotin carboxyl carrier protein of acetyl-CoA carboxylase n=1 Tax=Candidatus Methylacidithermus pantelleriae TaxID=2744239 RepID=A0A8J2FRP9_9BACT|nr:acetyl-CoA carboxylase biotin carboxyl carrier protein [Candidatus Methylacidithermus pantelleriae]CAF0692957.1 Biotin carboxyl carrier protein of acetyl-CoA carboxylase [Candidatus Methylacidithermus pantelleriae]